MAGYHLKEIEKGKLGEFSKIREEYLEMEDAITQNNLIMAFLEMSDMIGAIEAFLANHNLTLQDVIEMKEATKRAFESGSRK